MSDKPEEVRSDAEVMPSPEEITESAIENPDSHAVTFGASPEDLSSLCSPPIELAAESEFVFPGIRRLPAPGCRGRVAIIGFASSSRNKAPHDDPEFEIWGCNAVGRIVKGRFDRMFDPHQYDGPNPRIHLVDRLKWYSEWGGVVYMKQPHPDLVNSVELPYGRLAETFAPFTKGRPYFASTIAFMMALAIAEGFQEIHILGIDLVTEAEYGRQRGNLEHLIGFAQGLGRTVHVPEVSALLSSPWIYGYENEPQDGVVNKRMLRAMLAEARQKETAALASAHTLSGVIQTCQHQLDTIDAARKGQRQNLNMDKKPEEKTNG